jgi:hypothetical protein
MFNLWKLAIQKSSDSLQDCSSNSLKDGPENDVEEHRKEDCFLKPRLGVKISGSLER